MHCFFQTCSKRRWFFNLFRAFYEKFKQFLCRFFILEINALNDTLNVTNAAPTIAVLLLLILSGLVHKLCLISTRITSVAKRSDQWQGSKIQWKILESKNDKYCILPVVGVCFKVLKVTEIYERPQTRRSAVCCSTRETSWFRFSNESRAILAPTEPILKATITFVHCCEKRIEIFGTLLYARMPS